MKLMFALAFAAVLGGCSQSSSTDAGDGVAAPIKPASATPGADITPAPVALAADPTPVEQRKPKVGDEVAILNTDKGEIVLMFFPDKAPNHVENFKKLVKSGFYNGTKFHRVIPGFMIQGGDPNTKKADTSMWGQGGPDWSVKAEFNDVHHGRGILSMARSQDPDSAGSQFFIMVADNPSLDNQYSAFGKVVSGMAAVDKIVNLPRGEADRPNDPPAIKSAQIAKWPVK